jgi:hypothetical protein
MEYDYDWADFYEVQTNCMFCDEKLSGKRNKSIHCCTRCSKEYFITKTDAKREYRLIDDHLEDLEYYKINTFHGRKSTASLYMLKEIKLMAFETHLKLTCRNRDTYIQACQDLEQHFIDSDAQREQNKLMKMNELLTKNNLPISDEIRNIYMSRDRYGEKLFISRIRTLEQKKKNVALVHELLKDDFGYRAIEYVIDECPDDCDATFDSIYCILGEFIARYLRVKELIAELKKHNIPVDKYKIWCTSIYSNFVYDNIGTVDDIIATFND